MSGAFGLAQFLFWLHGPEATLRGIGDALYTLADRATPPRKLTARQVGALIALDLK